MVSKNSHSETIKEAVSAASRAISGNPELEVDLAGIGSSNGNLPKNLKELSSYRGKADALACIEKYRDKSIKINTGVERFNSLLKVMEDARVEILGSLHYPGIATNITSKFNDKCKLYESFEDQEDHLEIALETWLRQACLPNAESANSNLFLQYWGKLFDKQDTKLKNEIIDSLGDQARFLEIAEEFLRTLNIEDEETDSEDNDIEDETEQEEESASDSGLSLIHI